MDTRKHVHVEEFEIAPAALFAILVTPSAIRAWWGAARAIVVPEVGGIWCAAWGPEEDSPECVTTAHIRAFEPPHRLVLDHYRYYATTGSLPFDTDFETEFLIEPIGKGSLLRVTQEGFPAGPEGDTFLAACEVGWRETFSGIRQYVEG